MKYLWFLYLIILDGFLFLVSMSLLGIIYECIQNGSTKVDDSHSLTNLCVSDNILKTCMSNPLLLYVWWPMDMNSQQICAPEIFPGVVLAVWLLGEYGMFISLLSSELSWGFLRPNCIHAFILELTLRTKGWKKSENWQVISGKFVWEWERV